MTPNQLKTWRKKLALTQAEAAKSLYISLAQYRRIEAGEWPIPPLVAEVISLREQLSLKTTITPAVRAKKGQKEG